jgi:hypothetical protein
LVLVSCSKNTSDKDFIPPSDNARKALETALASWKANEPVGTVAGSDSPKIEALDPRWRDGQKLLEFQVIAEEPAQPGGARTFTVRLTLGNGPPAEVRYMILGIDPLWVYSEEEFNKLSGTGS